METWKKLKSHSILRARKTAQQGIAFSFFALLSGCLYMPQMEGGGLLSSTLRSVGRSSDGCDDRKGRAFYESNVNPLLENKCVACHSALSFRLIRGSASANYVFAKKKGQDIVEYATARKAHPGGQLFNSNDESLIERWLSIESECKTVRVSGGDSVCALESRPSESTAPGNNTNAARTSGSGLHLRLSSLFPGQSIPEKDFSLYESTGLNRSLALPQRFTSVSAQIAFLSKIETYCNSGVRSPRSEAGALLGEFRLSGETLPTDANERDILMIARNIWLYPYTPDSKEIRELLKAYQDTAAAVRYEGKGVEEASKIGKITACIAALQAPQFWLGNAGSMDVVRKTAIEVGRVLPTPADFDGFKTASNRSSWMKSFAQRLQQNSGYVNAVQYWHQDWLGTRPHNLGFDPRVGPTALRDSSAQNGPSRLMGLIGKVEKVTAGGTQLDGQYTLTALAEQYEASLVHNSEACENKIQNFDPRTTRIVWEQRNPALGGQFETIASHEFRDGQWISVPGSITLENGQKKTTTIADVNLGQKNTENHINGGAGFKYTLGGLVGTPLQYFQKGDRRIRRFSPSGEQNGYSPVKLYYSGTTAYTCNTLSRFIATCAYRPNASSSAQVPVTVFMYDESKRGTSKTATWNAEGHANFVTDTTYTPRYPRPVWLNQNFFVDTLAHPKILEHMRCGVPNPTEMAQMGKSGYSEDIAFPKGYTSETVPIAPTQSGLQDLAFNIHYRTTGLPVGSPERDALDSIRADLANDASRLIAHVLQNGLDYREILLANYTFGNDYTRLLLSTQNFTLPFRHPNAQLSSSPSTPKKITRTELGSLQRRWLTNIQGTHALPNSWVNFLNNSQKNKHGDEIPAKTIKGILTSVEMLAPVSPNIRTLSTRIITRLLCSDIGDYKPNESEYPLHQKFVTQKSHLQTTCIGCHINLDPVVTALNSNFAANPSLRFGGTLANEIDNSTAGNFYGIRGVDNPSEGALLGKPVLGVSGVAEVIANSDQFARCTVQKAFENIFGREVPSVADCAIAPNHPDCALVQSTAQKFKSTLGYDYNKMIQELVSSELNLRGN